MSAKIPEDKDEIIIRLLSEINRFRSLTEDESKMVERAISRAARAERRRKIDRSWYRPWKPSEDRKLIALMNKRARVGRSRAFKPCDDTRNLAKQLGRTVDAVERRIAKLRKAGKGPGGQLHMPW